LTDEPGRTNSVSSVVIRCRYDRRRTVAVGSDASTEEAIGSVLDLLDVHLFEGPEYRGSAVAADEVSVILGERADSEALDGIGSLLASLRGGPTVHVYVADPAGVRLVSPRSADFSGSEKPERYLQLMGAATTGTPWARPCCTGTGSAPAPPWNRGSPATTWTAPRSVPRSWSRPSTNNRSGATACAPSAS
jgi:hypothetical protein